MRTPSPTAATTRPMRHVVHVGCARTGVATAVTRPSATRRRASISTAVTRRIPNRKPPIADRESRLSPAGAHAALHRAHHLGDGDVVDAPHGLLAAALVDARALVHARDRHVVEPPWAVALGT